MRSIHLSPPIQPTRVKWVTFSIAGYRLGLSTKSVLRVVNCPPELEAQSHVVELVGIGQHTLSVVDLKSVLRGVTLHEARFGHRASTDISPKSEFLIVIKLEALGSLQNDFELCALRVDTPPDLIELDPASIRQLPSAYRQHHPLRIASQVAVLPQGKATLAIFLLEMNRVLKQLRE